MKKIIIPIVCIVIIAAIVITVILVNNKPEEQAELTTIQLSYLPLFHYIPIKITPKCFLFNWIKIFLYNKIHISKNTYIKIKNNS